MSVFSAHYFHLAVVLFAFSAHLLSPSLICDFLPALSLLSLPPSHHHFFLMSSPCVFPPPFPSRFSPIHASYSFFPCVASSLRYFLDTSEVCFILLGNVTSVLTGRLPGSGGQSAGQSAVELVSGACLCVHFSAPASTCVFVCLLIHPQTVFLLGLCRCPFLAVTVLPAWTYLDAAVLVYGGFGVSIGIKIDSR